MTTCSSVVKRAASRKGKKPCSSPLRYAKQLMPSKASAAPLSFAAAIRAFMPFSPPSCRSTFTRVSTFWRTPPLHQPEKRTFRF